MMNPQKTPTAFQPPKTKPIAHQTGRQQSIGAMMVMKMIQDYERQQKGK